MTIHELTKLAIKKLPLGNNTPARSGKRSVSGGSPALDGEVLLSFVLGKPKEYLAINPKKKVDEKIEKKYLTLLNRRLLGWPVAYLVKEKEFYNLKFYVDKRVLIPRPETEGLVDLVLEKVKNKKSKLKILDIGTGSGNIIISLTKKTRTHQYFGSDLSPKALLVAKKNARLHKTKVTFKQGDLLEPWKNKSFDILIANLPYLHRESDPSTKFEPKGALIAAKKGLALYEKLFKQIRPLEKPPQFIFLEIGRDQGRLIKKLAKKFLPAYETKIHKDLFGRTRFAILTLSSHS